MAQEEKYQARKVYAKRKNGGEVNGRRVFPLYNCRFSMAYHRGCGFFGSDVAWWW